MHRRKREGAGGELLGRLLECHVRIREMLTMGQTIEELGSAEETTAAADRLGRYFTRGLPMHTRDEDESVLPRLVGPEFATALDRMHREHREHEPLVQEVVDSCRDLLDEPSGWQELRAIVAGASEALSPIMASHLLQEERDLFPGVQRLGDDVQARILEEMEMRRAASW